MKRRPFLYGTLAALILLVCGLGMYLYSWFSGAAASYNTAKAAVAAIAADTAASRDSMPAEFARQFNTRYTVDTGTSVSGTLIIDTSYQASPRGHTVGGRKVSISICGVDSRLNERVEHADANHVVTVWLDSGFVDIVSIPRDTPCDAGFGKGNRLNILANVRAKKGRDAYLREVTTIAGLDTIEYYIDLGFSQARGVLELLGFHDNAGDALRILRSRQAFASGDFQRSFNQGQFIRQMLLANLDRMNSLGGDLAIRGGLFIVTSNLTVDTVKSIVAQLAAHHVDAAPERVTVSIEPAYYAKMAVFNFRDSTVLGSLLGRIDAKAKKLGITAGSGDSVMNSFRQRIDRLITKAAADTASSPVRVIAGLRRCFEQRIWWQLPGAAERSRVRKALGTLLASAYQRTGRPDQAEHVNGVVRFEEELAAAR